MKRLALALLAAGCLALAPPPSMQMRLDGHWEVIRGHADGRFDGASVRSYHPGDVLSVHLSGIGFRIYGVTGPNGGRAVVFLHNIPIGAIDFYSATKHTDVMLYASHTFAPGTYAVDLVVSPIHDADSHGTYVNVDKVELVR